MHTKPIPDPDPVLLWLATTIAAIMAGSGVLDSARSMIWPVALDERLLRPVRVEFGDPLKVIIDLDVLIEFDSNSLVQKVAKIAALCEINTAAKIEVDLHGPQKEQDMLRETIKRAVASHPTTTNYVA